MDNGIKIDNQYIQEKNKGCLVYINCHNAKKLKNKIKEFDKNIFYFNLKKLFRLKKYLVIANNLLITFTRKKIKYYGLKNSDEHSIVFSEMKTILINQTKNLEKQYIMLSKITSDTVLSQLDKNNLQQEMKKNTYTMPKIDNKFGNIIKKHFFNNKNSNQHNILFWLKNIKYLLDLDIVELNDSISNNVLEIETEIAKKNAKETVNKRVYEIIDHIEKNINNDNSIINLNNEKEYTNYVKNIETYINNLVNNIKYINILIQAINDCIYTSSEDYNKKLSENNNPIFDDLNDYINGNIISVSVIDKESLFNYSGCITQINRETHKCIITYYSKFSVKLEIIEVLISQLCFKKPNRLLRRNTKCDYKNNNEIHLVHEMRKIIFYFSDQEKCKINIDCDNAVKLLGIMNKYKQDDKQVVKQEDTNEVKQEDTKGYVIPIPDNNTVQISFTNFGIPYRGDISSINPIKRKFKVTYKTKIREKNEEKTFNFNLLCIKKTNNNCELINNVTINTDYEKIRQAVIKSENDHINDYIKLIKKPKSFMLFILKALKSGSLMLAIALIIGVFTAILYLSAPVIVGTGVAIASAISLAGAYVLLINWIYNYTHKEKIKRIKQQVGLISEPTPSPPPPSPPPQKDSGEVLQLICGILAAFLQFAF